MLIINAAAKPEWIKVEGHAVFQAASLGVVTTTGTTFWLPSSVGSSKKTLIRGFSCTIDPADPFVIDAGAPTGAGIGYFTNGGAGTGPQPLLSRLATFAIWNTQDQLGAGNIGGALWSSTIVNAGAIEVTTPAILDANYLVAGSVARGMLAICDGAAGVAQVRGSMYYSFEYHPF